MCDGVPSAFKYPGLPINSTSNVVCIALYFSDIIHCASTAYGLKVLTEKSLAILAAEIHKHESSSSQCEHRTFDLYIIGSTTDHSSVRYFV